MSFTYTSHHHGWYAAQVSHGTTYVVLTLSLLIRPVWPSNYQELVSLSQKKKTAVGRQRLAGIKWWEGRGGRTEAAGSTYAEEGGGGRPPPPFKRKLLV